MQLECGARTADHLKIRAVTDLRGGAAGLYLGSMSGSQGIAFRCVHVCLAALAVAGLLAAPASAQDAPDDEGGREYFERGRVAFENAEYESALVYFRHAYRLSQRGELQYNIGVAADRLQREEEALEAFRGYLADTEEPTRREEVDERIEALERSIAERKATELALEQATIRYQSSEAQPTDTARLPKSTIAGASTLGALGVVDVRVRSAWRRGSGRKRDLVCDQRASDEEESRDHRFDHAHRCGRIRKVLIRINRDTVSHLEDVAELDASVQHVGW
jgi:tetratricopeptide (TPR) repeat protein